MLESALSSDSGHSGEAILAPLDGWRARLPYPTLLAPLSGTVCGTAAGLKAYTVDLKRLPPPLYTKVLSLRF